MKISLTDFERQSEILAVCLNGGAFSKADYAQKYNVTEVTINRDLSELRQNGIQIYSRKNKVEVIEPPSRETLINISSNYLPLKLNSQIFENNVKSTLKSENKKYFSLLLLLAKAVNEKRIVKFNYKRLNDNQTSNYSVKPISLLTNDLNWILHGLKENENIVKTFYLSRMSRFELTDKKFKPANTPSLNNHKKYKMTFKFDPQVREEIISKAWFDDFEIYEDKNGYFILTTEQPITNKLAGWCVSWWDKLEIIEPDELKEYLTEMIKAFMKKN